MKMKKKAMLGKRVSGKISVFAVSLVLTASVLVVGVSAAARGWYCVRAKDHKRPVCDADMSYIADYGGYYIGREEDEKVVYLTFDAGYENGKVERVLDVLKSKGVRGSFFILGNLIERNGELVRRMADEGHIVANHTYSHRDMTKCSSAEEFVSELGRLEAAYRDLVGAEMPKYYRPPEGKFDEKTMKYASDAGYKTIFWSFAYADWDNDAQPSPSEAKKKILDNIHCGAVLLLHPTSATNAAILGDVIDTLISDGYRFGTLDELTGSDEI